MLLCAVAAGLLLPAHSAQPTMPELRKLEQFAYGKQPGGLMHCTSRVSVALTNTGACVLGVRDDNRTSDRGWGQCAV